MSRNRFHMGIRTKSTVSNTVLYVILVLMSIIWLTPFACILLESFRTESTGRVGYIIPKQWGFDNYMLIGDASHKPILRTLGFTGHGNIVSRLRFKGRKLLMNTCLVLGMFPGFVTMIVLYKVLSGMGLTGANSVPGLILVYCASSGMGYYVSKGFFDTIPKSLDEAARVDGASRFQVFYKVIMPLSKPIVIYTVLTAFMAPWGDFMFAKYISHNTEVGMNVAVGLQYWISSKTLIATNYTMFCAGGVVVALPVTILFMLLQRYYVEGVTGGAVKG